MRHRTAWSMCLGLLVVAAWLFCREASGRVELSHWPGLMFKTGPTTMDEIILIHGLFPRAAVALLAGAALGLSGALLQQVLRNPIADPSTLGISAGAQLAIVVATLFFPQLLDGNRVVVAVAGAAVAAGLVFALAWRASFEPVAIVVSGMLVGITAAAVSAALTLAQGEYLMSLVTWNGGSLSQQDWSVARSLLIELVACGAFAALMLRPLLVVGLGDAAARSLGVNLTAIRFGIAAVATALAAVVAAYVGLIGFVGLAAPAFVRGLGFRTPAAVIALSPPAGALFLWLCDGAVQSFAGASGESFPTGAVTAFIGGPLLLWLLPRVRSIETHGATMPLSRRIPLGRGIFAALILLPAMMALAFMIANDGERWTLLSIGQMIDLAPMRWPRFLAAAAAGGLLALTGATLQRLTGNAMASPEVIGVSGGAGLGFAAALTFVPEPGPLALALGAAAGGLAAMSALLLFASRKNLPPEKLLLAGIATGSFCSAVLSALMSAGDQRAWQILSWIGGTASTATSQTAIVLACMAILLLAVTMTCSRWLTLLQLGHAVSQSVGVPVRGSRVAILVICGLATGAASLLVGPLSFVGLIAPHMVAQAGFATTRHHLLVSFVFGALLMALADVGARTVTFPYELPLGLFAALIGAPYLIWLVGRRS